MIGEIRCYLYFREIHETRRKNIRTNNADPASPATSPNTASDTVTGICLLDADRHQQKYCKDPDHLLQ